MPQLSANAAVTDPPVENSPMTMPSPARDATAELPPPARPSASDDALLLPSDGAALFDLIDGIASRVEQLSATCAGFEQPARARLTVRALREFCQRLGEVNGQISKSLETAERLPTYQEPPPVSQAPTGDAEDGATSLNEAEGIEDSVLPRDRLISPTLEDDMYAVRGVNDPTTLLPTRVIGEKAIDAAIACGRPRYLAVLILDRLHHIATRFGRDVGIEALRHCAQFLEQKLPVGSLLIRWRGAAFVALFDISGTLPEARLSIEQLTIQKVKFHFITNHRSALLNLTLDHQTYSVTDAINHKILGWQVDDFIEEHSARQPH